MVTGERPGSEVHRAVERPPHAGESDCGASSATVLVLNAGSSSLKFAIYAMPAAQALASGEISGIDGAGAEFSWRTGLTPAVSRVLTDGSPRAAQAAVAALVEDWVHAGTVPTITAVGHRVVHGGERFCAPVRLDAKTLAELAALDVLAPLHNTMAREGAEFFAARWPGRVQVAVFDTAFHRDLPAPARYYGLPLELQRRHGIRRYGFHGLSHAHVAACAADWLQKPIDTLKLISLHLGSGASACAILNGRSVDTSMGYTPLEGLLMGSRCGDLDPALPAVIAARAGLDAAGLARLLYKESGLQGLCGSADMRSVLARRAAGDPDATLAFDLYCYRIRKYVGAYVAVLNGLDALIFTGGIGARAAAVRAAVCADLEVLGIGIDPLRNAAAGDAICAVGRVDRPVTVLVVPTNEELVIARATAACLANATGTPASTED